MHAPRVPPYPSISWNVRPHSLSRACAHGLRACARAIAHARARAEAVDDATDAMQQRKTGSGAARIEPVLSRDFTPSEICAGACEALAVPFVAAPRAVGSDWLP